MEDTVYPGQWREELRAECKIADMNIVEDLARLYEEEDRDRLKTQLRDRYHQLVGVDPDQRMEFRAALHGIVSGDRQTVENLVTQFSRERRRAVNQRTSGMDQPVGWP